MIGRFFLAVIILSSLSWIGYVGFDILNVKSNFSASNVFSKEDGRVLIVNRPEEVRFELINDFQNAPFFNLAKELNKNDYETAFVSFNRSQILLKRNDNWTEENISSLLSNTATKIIFNGASFDFGELKGEYFKSNLYLFQGKFTKNKLVSIDLTFDKKSSASIIEISDESKVKSVADVYFMREETEDGEIIRFKTIDASVHQGKKIKDEVLFSPVVTKNFSSYHFFERDYFSSKDTIFANGPMSKWMQNGFVQVVYKGKKAIISDYIGGQDPLLVLNDLIQSQDENKFSIPLTSSFPSNEKEYFVKYLADFVVISQSEMTCNQLIADYKLGKTIALSSKMIEHVYGKLPQSVSERFVSEESSYSRSVFQKYILQTQFEGAVLIAEVEKKETTSVNCEFDIKDFISLRKDGEVFALSKTNEVSFIQNGQLKWKKALNEKTFGNIQVIDLYSNKELFLLVNTEDKIHLINQKGEYSSGFPITLETEATNNVKFYRWKGKSYFIVAMKDNQVSLFDGEGRELNVFKSEQPITKRIDVWASQNKLFAGFSNSTHFEMFSLEKNKSHRVFDLPTEMISAKIPNELIQFGIENDFLIKIDQKGTKFKFSKIPNAKIIKVEQLTKNPIVVVKIANEIRLFNSDGVLFSTIKLSFNEVENVHIFTSSAGKTTVAILDGLENNVYLYDTNGELVNQSMEGQTKIQLQSFNKTMKLTTVIDQFIVQYYY